MGFDSYLPWIPENILMKWVIEDLDESSKVGIEWQWRPVYFIFNNLNGMLAKRPGRVYQVVKA